MMTRQARQNFFSGLSGIELPVPKYQFPQEYQKTSRLTYYSTFFNSIEINSSFYKLPMHTTVAKWAASVGNDFKFTFKLFRELTHCKNLEYDSSHIERFIQAISFVGDKKGCVLLQFPPSLKDDNFHGLHNLMNDLKRADPQGLWRLAVEFRYPGWYNNDVYDLLESHQASLVMHDIAKSATPMNKVRANYIYVRFHGPTGNYRGSYTEAFLQEYAEYVKDWLIEGKTVYVYFNNTAGDAFNNLRTFNSFLHP